MRAIDRLRRSPVLVGWLIASPTPWRDSWLAIRMGAWAVAIPLLKHLLPLPALVRIMWKDARRTQRDRKREQRVVRLADWLSRAANLTTRGPCLTRSLLAYRFLSELDAAPRLMVAFRRSDNRAIAGHAWVVVDGKAIGERPDDLNEFLPAVSFGPRGRVVPL